MTAHCLILQAFSSVETDSNNEIQDKVVRTPVPHSQHEMSCVEGIRRCKMEDMREARRKSDRY